MIRTKQNVLIPAAYGGYTGYSWNKDYRDSYNNNARETVENIGMATTTAVGITVSIDSLFAKKLFVTMMHVFQEIRRTACYNLLPPWV